jgi:hypothetical protein
MKQNIKQNIFIFLILFSTRQVVANSLDVDKNKMTLRNRATDA